MYRILLADDEGIMLTSLSNIISGHFGEQCEIATAKTGSSVLEQAENFKPDLIFLDIRMPGLSGIEAMQELRKKDTDVVIVILTAYDKFDYAKEALSLGAFEFLTKPVNKNVIIDVITRAFAQIEDKKNTRISNLRIREKLETVVPIIENGFVSNFVFQNVDDSENTYYKELLDIHAEYGYVMLIRFGEALEKGVLTNPVGMSMRAQQFYREMREIIKQQYTCIISAIMGNRVVVVVTKNGTPETYEERIAQIEGARNLVRVLEERIEARFRIGIGKTYELNHLAASYQDAYKALSLSRNHVVHYEDTAVTRRFEGDYPRDTEDRLYQAARQGNVEETIQQANLFFDWMVEQKEGDINDIRLKILEFVMTAEKTEFDDNGGTCGFLIRKGYLEAVMGMDTEEALRNWFVEKMEQVSHLARRDREDQTEELVITAKKYIARHFADNISLEEVSRQVNMSPYYFSKLFKEEAGTTFIDYLTSVRIHKAKELLEDHRLSIKEVCNRAGYHDPNYFSRIFKKQEMVTPSEYRERIGR